MAANAAGPYRLVVLQSFTVYRTTALETCVVGRSLDAIEIEVSTALWDRT